MARIRTPLLRPGMRLKDLHADEFNEAFSAGQHFANMRVGEGLAFKFSPVGGAMLTLTQQAARIRPGVVVAMFVIRDIEDDYWVCRTYDGSAVGEDDVNVAKDFEMQRTPHDGQMELRVIGAQTKSVTYQNYGPGGVTREAVTIGSNNEPETITQAITPAFVKWNGEQGSQSSASVIWAERGIARGTLAKSLAGDAIPWIDTNRAGRGFGNAFTE